MSSAAPKTETTAPAAPLPRVQDDPAYRAAFDRRNQLASRQDEVTREIRAEHERRGRAAQLRAEQARRMAHGEPEPPTAEAPADLAALVREQTLLSMALHEADQLVREAEHNAAARIRDAVMPEYHDLIRRQLEAARILEQALTAELQICDRLSQAGVSANSFQRIVLISRDRLSWSIDYEIRERAKMFHGLDLS